MIDQAALRALAAGDGLAIDLLGYIADGAGLALADLCELTGRPPDLIAALLGGLSCGGLVSEDDGAFRVTELGRLAHDRLEAREELLDLALYAELIPGRAHRATGHDRGA